MHSAACDIFWTGVFEGSIAAGEPSNDYMGYDLCPCILFEEVSAPDDGQLPSERVPLSDCPSAASGQRSVSERLFRGRHDR